jgi:hypothetical protein
VFCVKLDLAAERLMSDTTDFDRIVEELRQELDRLWTAYHQATPEEKPDLRKLYVDALHRFATLVTHS